MSLYDRSRTDWERPGYTVAEHTTSRPIDWRRVRYAVIHYTAAKRTGQTPDYIAAMQRAYVSSRGYSLGYSVVIDKAGVAWQVRGDDYMPAANVEVNRSSFAILLLTDGDEPASPIMVERTRRIIAAVRERAYQYVRIVGHGEVGATACPGAGIRDQIARGEFEPRQEDDMYEPITPTRVLDTRPTGRLARDSEIVVNAGRAGARAAHVNLTCVGSTGEGFFTAWASGARPNASVLNTWVPGQIVCNAVNVPLAPDGTFRVYTSAGENLLVDVMGYYV